MMSEYYSLVDSEGNATEVIAEIKIGRAKTNDIVLADPRTSRHHATVFLDGKSLIIRDEQSVNGILVNGQKIYEPTLLNDLDRLMFGDEILIVKAPTAQAETAMAIGIDDEDDLRTVVNSLVDDLDQTSLAGNKKFVEKQFPSELSPEMDGGGINSDKKDNRLNIAIILLVIVLLCVCCISIVLIYFFVIRDTSIIFTPQNIPIDSLSGYIL